MTANHQDNQNNQNGNDNPAILTFNKDQVVSKEEHQQNFVKEIEAIQRKYGLALVAVVEHRMLGQVLQAEAVMKIAEVR